MSAEREMRTNPGRARISLTVLINQAALTPAGAQALTDLAWLAIRDKDFTTAHAALARLAVHPAREALALPAAELTCLAEDNPVPQRTCLIMFRILHPGSLLDADALARLANSYASSGDCADARPLLDEYQRRYPTGPDAAALAAWRARCTP
jgi:outer membrane protein assembly factor BamD (BamD/ComL family)